MKNSEIWTRFRNQGSAFLWHFHPAELPEHLPLRGLLPHLLASVLLQPALPFPLCSFEDFPQQLGEGGVYFRGPCGSGSSQPSTDSTWPSEGNWLLVRQRDSWPNVQVPWRKGTGSGSEACAPLLMEAGPTPLPAQLPCYCNTMFIKAPALGGGWRL